MINARAETVVERPAFRDAIKKRRVALVFDGFYEWRRPGPPEKGPAQPFYFHRADSQPLVFAGVSSSWYDAEGRLLRTCAIVTTTANATMAPVHHRMPVVLSQETWHEWLGRGELRPSRLHELLRPAPGDVLRSHMVSTAVNNARNDGPELVAPMTTALHSTTEGAEPLQLFGPGAPACAGWA